MKDCKDELSLIKTRIISELMSANFSQADTHEIGEVVDMVKDICQAEKYCAETCYYETVTEAMLEGGSYEERMGYTSKYNGIRHTPNRMGYKPYLDQEPYVRDYIHNQGEDRMGYTYPNRMGHTETDPKMVEHHIKDMLETLKEFYEKGDPTMKKQIKTDIQKLVNDMPN